jgi:NAD+ synthase (glutamine-hydrolysing)
MPATAHHFPIPAQTLYFWDGGKAQHMRIALAQLNYHIGNFEGNLRQMKHAVDEAAAAHATLVVFAELSVCGYPPRDFLEFDDFIERCLDSVERLAAYCHEKGMAAIVGGPAKNPVAKGKHLFNAAFFLEGGTIRHIAHKALLPTYDIFDECRYFEAGKEFSVVEYQGKKLAITICEDLWNLGNENPLYTMSPMDRLEEQQPDIMINIAASPYDHTHLEQRTRVLKENVRTYGLPLLYVNQTGGQTEILFDGGSLAVNDKGKVVAELPYFESAIRVFDWEQLFHTFNPIDTDHNKPREKYPVVHKALVQGVRDYFGKLGFDKAILGLSGGVDSALVLVLAAQALGKEHVKAVLMPSMYSSEHSMSDARQLVQNLGVEHTTIPVKEVYDRYLDVLEPHFGNKPFGTAEENLQARIRANYLMALSNKHGHILLNTSNKSEAAVGYTTIYGDMCGGLSVIGDLYKTEVYELCRWINRGEEVIPERIITKAPSAELRPGQKDEDTLPRYEILDKILYAYIEERQDPADIAKLGFKRDLVDQVLKLVNINEYKRFQAVPGLKISAKSFGSGRRQPLVQQWTSERDN